MSLMDAVETNVTETAPDPTSARSTASEWRARIGPAEKARKDRIGDWQQNVAYRLLKPFSKGAVDTTTELSVDLQVISST